jgi:hypothetical protein
VCVSLEANILDQEVFINKHQDLHRKISAVSALQLGIFNHNRQFLPNKTIWNKTIGAKNSSGLWQLDTPIIFNTLNLWRPDSWIDAVQYICSGFPFNMILQVYGIC